MRLEGDEDTELAFYAASGGEFQEQDSSARTLTSDLPETHDNKSGRPRQLNTKKWRR